MKMLKMMKTNVSMVLLEMRHPLSMGLSVNSRPHKAGGLSRKSFLGCFLEFVMGVIDDRDCLT